MKIQRKMMGLIFVIMLLLTAFFPLCSAENDAGESGSEGSSDSQTEGSENGDNSDSEESQEDDSGDQENDNDQEEGENEEENDTPDSKVLIIIIKIGLIVVSIFGPADGGYGAVQGEMIDGIGEKIEEIEEGAKSKQEQIDDACDQY